MDTMNSLPLLPPRAADDARSALAYSLNRDRLRAADAPELVQRLAAMIVGQAPSLPAPRGQEQAR